MTSPVLSALQTASSQIKAAGQGQVPTGQKNPDGSSVMTEGNAADKAGGIGLSFTLGSSRSQSQQSSSADLARVNRVTAGGDISIRATGGGADSDLTLRGSTVQAAGKTRLQAEDQINILAAQNLTQESNSQSSKSGSVGVGINLGAGGLNAGVTVSASRGTGQGAGNGSTYSNSQIAGSQVTLESGGDTTIKGGVVQGERLIAQVGGNLNIESLQDKSQYREKSQQVGGSVTIGPSPGGSLSAGQTKINSDYLSVGEQSAIRAGDGGFNVSVQGKTELTGAQITSTQAAIDQGRNRYEAKQGTTTTDLQNSASYEAKSVSVGLAAGTPKPGASVSAGLSGAGLGSDSGSASSTSTAGISGIAGNTAARTGDAESGLKPIFDKDKARQEVNAQVAITSEFGKQASKAVGDYAKQQHDKAKEAGDKDGMAAWEEGGKNRVALHVLVGGLTGGVQGAVGAGAASVAAPSIDALQSGLRSALKDAGLGDSAANLISGLAGGATAATIGAAASGGTTGAATAFNADMNNRQLHFTEAQKLAALKEGKTKQEQERLDAAACALVRCADGVPSSDPNKARLVAMQTAGTGYFKEQQQQLQASGEFVYDKLDPTRDWITRHGEAAQRLGGAVNLGAGAVGTVGMGVLTTGQAVACPATAISCAGAAFTGTLSVMSFQQAREGTQALVGGYKSTEGQRVLDSFNMDTYPGERTILKNARRRERQSRPNGPCCQVHSQGIGGCRRGCGRAVDGQDKRGSTGRADGRCSAEARRQDGRRAL